MDFILPMAKLGVVCIRLLLLSQSICIGLYSGTQRPPSSYWSAHTTPRTGTQTDPYHRLMPKESPRYDHRQDTYYSQSTAGYGPPPLGPLAQKADPPRYHASSGAAVPVEHNYLSSSYAGRPSCARKRDYCLHDHDYPMDMMQVVIQRHRSDIYSMYSQMQNQLPPDGATLRNSTYRYNFPSEQGVWACETDIFLMRIGWARNWAGRWKVVVNTDQFPQTVRVEHCKFENRSCQFMPPCVRSTCLQRYTAVQLLSADPQDPNQSPMIDTFLLPGGCSCFIEELKFS